MKRETNIAKIAEDLVFGSPITKKNKKFGDSCAKSPYLTILRVATIPVTTYNIGELRTKRPPR